MRGWTFLLGGLIVWTVHFFALYAIGSIFLTTPLARILVLLATLACLIVAGFLLKTALRTEGGTPTDRWMRSVALGGLGLATVAMVWQAIPALLA